MKKSKQLVCMLSFLAITPLLAESCQKEEVAKKELCDFPIRKKMEKCERGYFFNVGLIAEQISLTGAEVAIINSNKTETLDSASQVVFQDQVREPIFDLDVGLRVGLGYQLEHDNWMASVSFEWLSSKGRYDHSAVGNELIFPYEVTSPFYGAAKLNFNSVNSKLTVDYYLLDFILAKGVYFTSKFSFEPFAGVKVAWINYTGQHVYGVVQSGSIPENSVFQRNNSVETWGIGPEVGVNAFYELIGGWSIFSSTNGSVLLGNASIKNLIRLVPTAESGYQPERAQQSQTAICPTLRTTFGLEYIGEAFNEKQSFFVRFGFDGRYYFNQYPNLGYRAVAGTATNELDYNPLVTSNGFGMVGLLADLGWYF